MSQSAMHACRPARGHELALLAVLGLGLLLLAAGAGIAVTLA